MTHLQNWRRPYVEMVRHAQRVARFCVATKMPSHGMLMWRTLNKAGEDELHYRLCRFVNGAEMDMHNGPHNLSLLFRALGRRLELSYLDEQIVYRVMGSRFHHHIGEGYLVEVSVDSLNHAGVLLKMTDASDEAILDRVTQFLLQA